MSDVDPAPASEPARPAGRPPLGRLVLGFLIGSIYLALVAAVIDAGTAYSFWHALVMIVAAAGTLFVIFLAVAVRAATAKPTGRWQINLSTLLLFTAAIAIYFGLMQWLVRGAGVSPGDMTIGTWLSVFAVSGLVLVLSVPYVVFLGESLLWLAVWLVRRRITQRILRLVLRRVARTK